MKNFDPRWKSPEDYILGITYEIWEDRGINTLNQYYADDIVVRSPASVVVGNQGIKAATMATLAELPDRELLGEDVIWCDAPDGFLSSHRLVSTATHTTQVFTVRLQEKPSRTGSLRTVIAPKTKSKTNG